MIKALSLTFIVLSIVSCNPGSSDPAPSDLDALLAAHEQVLEAHRPRDVALMMGIEGAETVLVATGGISAG